MGNQELYNQGLDLFGQEKYEEAVETFQKAIQEDSNNGEIYMALSMTYQRMGKLDEAIDAAKQAARLMPNEPLAFTNLSRVYQQKGMIPEAEEAMAYSRQLSGM